MSIVQSWWQSKGKKLDTSLQSGNNWATNNLCKQLLSHLASSLIFPYLSTEYHENYYILHFEVQIHCLMSKKKENGVFDFVQTIVVSSEQR